MLYLSGTQSADISPLANLYALQRLDLNGTKVTNIAPLAELFALRRLSLSKTQIRDIRPIKDLPNLGERPIGGLFVADTPIQDLDPELSRLSHIEDNHQRTKDIQAYLRTLPPYPEPLPWEETPERTQPKPEDVPTPRYAPLQVVEIDGVLQQVGLAANSQAASARLAEQGWAALRDYLTDLQEHQERIGNAMPRLARALDRLRAAMGEEYAEINAIAVGTHGNRVIRQSAFATDALMDEDAADVEEFAAALTLFLDRFIDWRLYKEEAEAAVIDPVEARSSVPDVLVLTEELRVMPEVGSEVTDELEALAQDVEEDAENPIVAKGLLSSLSNVFAAMGTAAMGFLKTARDELGDLTAKTWDESKTKIAKGVGTAFGIAAAGFIIAKATELLGFASRFGTELGWLQKFLHAFGLA